MRKSDFLRASSALCLLGCALSAQGAGASRDAHSLTVAAPPSDGANADVSGLDTVADAVRGRTLRLGGEVVRVLDEDGFRVSDGTGSIVVRLPWTGPMPVSAGDRVVVEGVVDDEMTFGLSRPWVRASLLTLGDGTSIRFGTPARETERTGERTAASDGAAGSAVTPIGSLAPGSVMTIEGRVARVLDTDEFRLEDESGSVRVYIGWTHRVPYAVGDRAKVVGVLDDDTPASRREFYAEALVFEDGRVVRVGGATPDDAADPDARPRAVADRARPAEPTPIGSLRAYETVLLEGVVERITDEDEFRIRDASGSVRVYIGWRNRMPVRPGEPVSVLGIVDSMGPGGLFKEVYAYEITGPGGRVFDLQPDRVSAEPAGGPRETDAAATPASLDDSVIPVRDVRRGQPVTLRGRVARIRDTDEFVLADATGSIRVYIGWRNRMPVAPGDAVTVVGFADDDVLPWMRPEVYADRLVLEDGRVVVLERGGYDDY